jgi:GNAT superfamily N-acetyltransferase
VHGAIRIDNLTVYDAYERQGIGTTVVRALLDFADEHRLVLLANNVLADATNFWRSRSVGFIMDPNNPDDFLPPHHLARTQHLTIPW